MDKPIIKNWIKYWTTTLAVSGMLVMGACDNNEQEQAVADEQIPERENVVNAPVEEEAFEEEPVVEEPVEEETADFEPTANVVEADVYAPIRNIESIIEEHEDANEAITLTLTEMTRDYDLINETNTTTADDYYNTDRNVYDQEDPMQTDPTQQQNTLDDQGTYQDTTAVGQEDEQDLNMLIIERYQMVNPQELNEEDRQRMERIMADYTRRLETMEGEINPETGAYISPEVNARPVKDIEAIQEQIRDEITYPQNAIAGGIEGIVFVRFVVDEQGNVTQAKAVEEVLVSNPGSEMAMKPLGEAGILEEEELVEAKKRLLQEAVRAVEATSGEWLPGEQNGEKVPTEVQIPVQFQIGGADSQGPVELR